MRKCEGKWVKTGKKEKISDSFQGGLCQYGGHYLDPITANFISSMCYDAKGSVCTIFEWFLQENIPLAKYEV